MDQGETRKSAMEPRRNLSPACQPALARSTARIPLAELAVRVAEGEAAGRPLRRDDNFDELFEEFPEGRRLSAAAGAAPSLTPAIWQAFEPAIAGFWVLWLIDACFGDGSGELCSSVGRARCFAPEPLASSGSSEAGPPAKPALRGYAAGIRSRDGVMSVAERAASRRSRPRRLLLLPSRLGLRRGGAMVAGAAASAAMASAAVSRPPQPDGNRSRPSLNLRPPEQPSTGRRGCMLAAGVLGVAAIAS